MEFCRNLDTKGKVWLDSLAFNLMPTSKYSFGSGHSPLALIEQIIDKGGICVISNGFLDVAEFQENLEETRTLLKTEKLIIEASMVREGLESLEDCRTQNVFEIIARIGRRATFWVSDFKDAPASTSAEDPFEESIKGLENKKEIMELRKLMECFAKEPMEWLKDEKIPEEPQDIKLKKWLRLPPSASVEDVIRMASKLNRIYAYESVYYRRWNEWTARLHGCSFMVTFTGDLKEV